MSANTKNIPATNWKNEPKVVLVLVNYNCSLDLLTCLRSLETLDYNNYEIVVVDNNSTEQGLDILSAQVNAMGGTFIRFPENGGFAAGNNVGIHHALASSADYIWLLNPDTVVARDSLSALVTRAQKAQSPLVLGSKILYGDLEPQAALAHASAGPKAGTERIWSAGGKMSSAERTVDMCGLGQIDDGSFDSERACDYLPGCSLFFSKDIVTNMGMMRENFFMYFEETDWCTQLRKKGVQLLYVPASVVWHRFVDDKLQGSTTVYYYNRNELFFWYEQLPFVARMKMIANVLLKKLPQAKKAFKEATTEELRRIFSAHICANRDFLLGRRGPRPERSLAE